jgi:hypothetical protein
LSADSPLLCRILPKTMRQQVRESYEALPSRRRFGQSVIESGVQRQILCKEYETAQRFPRALLRRNGCENCQISTESVNFSIR